MSVKFQLWISEQLHQKLCEKADAVEKTPQHVAIEKLSQSLEVPFVEPRRGKRAKQIPE